MQFKAKLNSLPKLKLTEGSFLVIDSDAVTFDCINEEGGVKQISVEIRRLENIKDVFTTEPVSRVDSSIGE